MQAAPGKGHYEILWEKNYMTTKLPHGNEVRRVVDLLTLSSVANAQEGKGEAALDNVRGVINASRSVIDEPDVIAFVLRLHCDKQAARLIEEALAQSEPSRESLSSIESLVSEEKDDLDRHFEDTVRFERAALFQLFGLAANGEVDISSMAAGKSLPPNGWDYALGLAYVFPRIRCIQKSTTEIMTKQVAISRLPPEARADASVALSRDFAREAKAAWSWEKATYLLIPAIDKVVFAHLITRMRLQSASLALACERYRLKHDDWPDIIEDLIPEYLDKVPQDCFRKAPLNFRRLPDGIVIYSVGPDGEDNGGLIVRGERPPPKERGVPANEDIGFRLWSPKARRQPPPAPDAEK